jgi:hypothetical protein
MLLVGFGLCVVSPTRAAAEPTLKFALLPPGPELKQAYDARLTKALDTYLRDFAIDVVDVTALPRDEASALNWLAAAKAADGGDFWVWMIGPADLQGEAELFLADVRAASPVVSSLRVGWPAEPDAGFFRGLALRLRGLLSAALGTSPEHAAHPTPQPVLDQPAAELSLRVPVHSPEGLEPESPPPGLERRLVIGASMTAGSALLSPKSVVPSAGMTAGMAVGPWVLQLSASRSLPMGHRDGDESASTTLFRAAVAAQRCSTTLIGRLVGGCVAVEAGALLVQTSGSSGQGGARSFATTAPVFAAGAMAAMALGTKVTLLAGPSIWGFPWRRDILVREVRMFSTGWIMPNFELHMRATI